MARGGYRAGGGRPPGIKETKPRRRKKPSGDSDQVKIRQMLAMGIRAKARMYQEFLHRVGRDENLSITEKKMMLTLGEELTAEIGEKPPESGGVAEDLTPLDLMLRGMRDPNEPKETRYRLAIAAAPFCHSRVGEGIGKKEGKAEKAKVAGAGRFRASSPPQIKLVK